MAPEAQKVPEGPCSLEKTPLFLPTPLFIPTIDLVALKSTLFKTEKSRDDIIDPVQGETRGIIIDPVQDLDAWNNNRPCSRSRRDDKLDPVQDLDAMISSTSIV